MINFYGLGNLFFVYVVTMSSIIRQKLYTICVFGVSGMKQSDRIYCCNFVKGEGEEERCQCRGYESYKEVLK